MEITLSASLQFVKDWVNKTQPKDITTFIVSFQEVEEQFIKVCKCVKYKTSRVGIFSTVLNAVQLFTLDDVPGNVIGIKKPVKITFHHDDLIWLNSNANHFYRFWLNVWISHFLALDELKHLQSVTIDDLKYHFSINNRMYPVVENEEIKLGFMREMSTQQSLYAPIVFGVLEIKQANCLRGVDKGLVGNTDCNAFENKSSLAPCVEMSKTCSSCN